MGHKIKKLIDERICSLECKTCGSIHHVIVKPDSSGFFYHAILKGQNCCYCE